MKEKCDMCHKELLCGEVYFCVGCSAIEAAKFGPVAAGEEFSDMELQWFLGFPKVVDVVNVITEDDIVGEVHTCGMCNVPTGFPYVGNCDACSDILYADYCACGEEGHTTCICGNGRTSGQVAPTCDIPF